MNGLRRLDMAAREIEQGQQPGLHSAGNAVAPNLMNADRPSPPGGVSDKQSGRLWLAGVLLLAAVLRLTALDRLPPGLNQDESVNAWNAYCLLKTGRDQTGTPWPVFSYRALGSNRSALFLYLLIPFQALGGLNVWTLRLPAALAGVLTAGLTYRLGRRLFGRRVALAAAFLLAVNPTHVQMSRWGHEASITPLLALVPLAAMLWARLPLDDVRDAPRPLRALAAGLLTGLCCYGYPAVRIYIPAALTAAFLVTAPAWFRLLRSAQGRRALAGFGLGVALTFGPLAAMHILHPEVIARRGQMTWLWAPDDPIGLRAGRVVQRFFQHFGYTFLFKTGDLDEIAWTAGFGFMPRYILPLWGVGLAAALARAGTSRAARVLLVTAAMFPVGDSFNWHISMHALRCSAGLAPLVLLAGLGLVRLLDYLRGRNLWASLVAVGVMLGLLAGPETVRFAYSYVHDRPRQDAIYHNNACDLIQACRWLRPRLEEVDLVVCTTLGMNQPYLATLMALRYEPEVWFTVPREVHPTATWDVYRRYGKFYFLPEWETPTFLADLEDAGRPQRVVLFLRATEPPPGKPVERIIGPDGKPSLVIYDIRL